MCEHLHGVRNVSGPYIFRWLIRFTTISDDFLCCIHAFTEINKNTNSQAQRILLVFFIVRENRIIC